MSPKIFLTGFMGSGKTYWGKIWAKENHLIFFDLDDEIEKVTGETIANIFETGGEEHFRKMERDILRKFTRKTNFILACGGGTPCFFENLQWMNEEGNTIYLQASATQILHRIINETRERPLVSKVNQSELLLFIQQKLKEREPVYKQAKHILNVDDLTTNSLAEIIPELRIRN